MANLFIFGDSFSEDWKVIPKSQLREKYLQSLNRIPIHYSDVLKNHFNLDNVFNFAKGGNDNYTIFETICKNIEKIKPDDCVVVQWSTITRYRFVKNDTWIITSMIEKSGEIVNQEYERNCNITLDEIKNWMMLLKRTLPKNTIYWTPNIFSYESAPFYVPNFKPKTISDDSTINDGHFSENGMIEVGEWLIKKFLNNSIYKIKLVN